MKTQWLTIELGEHPKTQLIQETRTNLLTGYVSLTGFPGSTGHFDWLRSTSADVIGVRYWPFDDAVHAHAVQRLLKTCRSLEYTVVDPDNRFVSIIFRGRSDQIDERLSNDQDMGDNGIYANDDGRVALCFEVDATVSGRLQVTRNSCGELHTP